MWGGGDSEEESGEPPPSSSSSSSSPDEDPALASSRPTTTKTTAAEEEEDAPRAVTPGFGEEGQLTMWGGGDSEEESGDGRPSPPPSYPPSSSAAAAATTNTTNTAATTIRPIVARKPPNVQRVYKIVQRHTGSIGGNGHGGAIYGELTIGSMQKMTDLMIKHTGLSKESRFIDVGCGLGKPNLHVAQYPGVNFSYGIEMQHVRWMLGMSNLEHVLKAAVEDEVHGIETTKIGCNLFFSHGDIAEATSFDPFTHVYMFDIG